ncbi:hypothetical protein BJV74DRAFT_949593 [Russula compacta]|nr:hypothetical protein BJV74DRAFT_949593 [Russula compacta]
MTPLLSKRVKRQCNIDPEGRQASDPALSTALGSRLSGMPDRRPLANSGSTTTLITILIAVLLHVTSRARINFDGTATRSVGLDPGWHPSTPGLVLYARRRPRAVSFDVRLRHL